MSQQPRILCVDDDPNVLEGLERTLGMDYAVETAPGGPEGLEAIAHRGPFAVVISDMRMPRMDGATFLAEVRRRAPESVRLLLSGQSEIAAAVAAVNDGQVFRFLTKPCPPEQLLATVESAVEHYRLRRAERDLLEQTVRGCVRALTQALSLVSPQAVGRSARLARWVSQMAKATADDNAWIHETAALLSQIGCIAVPGEILSKVVAGQVLNETERARFADHPRLGFDLVARIPRLERVAQIVRDQRSGPAPASAAKADAAPDPIVATGVEFLALALAIDAEVSRGASMAEAARHVRARWGARLGARLGASLDGLQQGDTDRRMREVSIDELTVHMTLDQDLRSRQGALVAARGQDVTPVVLRVLGNLVEAGQIDGRVRIVMREAA